MSRVIYEEIDRRGYRSDVSLDPLVAAALVFRKGKEVSVLPKSDWR